jgi:4-hydroxy-tetrahydrodipicolinate synthase
MKRKKMNIDINISKKQYKGIWPVMITPFQPDGKVDIGCYRELVQWYLDKGVHGVFAACYASEIFDLEQSEIMALVENTVELCKGCVPVAATASIGDDIDAHIQLGKQYIEAGVDVVVLTPPSFCKDDAALEEYFLSVADKLDCDMGVYECPVPRPKRLLSLGVIKTLAESGRYKAFKDTCCNLEMIKDRVEVIRGTEFAILQANTALLVDALKTGAKGLMGPIANVAPEYAVEVYNKYEEGGLDEILAVLFEVQELVSLNYVQAMKYILSCRGFSIQTSVRNGNELSEEHKQLIKNGLTSLTLPLPEL